ncbi:DUF2505 domain-containing protein [Brevibacterium otitidis]|uniref:DUF2505 domain-containing protein n=1 Tax=Brevibacterium otitidis TaxID=53364 RepID=A0ABV5X5Z7_9MICO|nr:hypothetical protein GCM10023233_17670 [Brevibacterium otitidis]
MKTITAQRTSQSALHSILTRLESPQLWNHYDAEVEITGSATTGLDVRTSAPLPASETPEQARRFMTQDARVEQHFSLPATAADAPSARAQQSVTVTGMPVTVTAVIDFSALDPSDVAGSGTQISVNAEVSSKMLLLGSAVESAAAPAIERMLTKRLQEIADL